MDYGDRGHGRAGGEAFSDRGDATALDRMVRAELKSFFSALAHVPRVSSVSILVLYRKSLLDFADGRSVDRDDRLDSARGPLADRSDRSMDRDGPLDSARDRSPDRNDR